MQGTLAGEKLRKGLDLTSWEAATNVVREWESRGSVTAEVIRVADAVERFLKDAEARNLVAGSIKNHRIILEQQLIPFCETKGITFLSRLGVEELREFRQGWKLAPITAVKRLERLRSFFRFAVNSGWLTTNPVIHVKPPKVTAPPTMPFTPAEMKAILSACDQWPDNWGRLGSDDAKRLRALVLLLRYSGLRIGDATMLPVSKLEGSKILYYTAKTNVPVYVPLPPWVAEEIKRVKRTNPEYFFWTGHGTPATVTGKWRDRLARIFKSAKIEGAHPHRFRDTAAVEWLQAGIPLDQVSILLGHNSTKVTEKSYNPWIKSRQDNLEKLVAASWGPEPVGKGNVLGFRAKGK